MKITNKDKRGDYFCYLNLLKSNPEIFNDRALRNLFKIQNQVLRILKKFNIEKLREAFRKDPAYKFFKKNKNQNKDEKFMICILSGLNVYGASLQIDQKSYKKMIHSFNCVFDSESIFEMHE